MEEINEELLYDKSLQCPVCDNKFASKQVKKSKLRVEKRDSDLFTHYKKGNPVIYNAFVCPECGYGATANGFGHITQKAKDIILKKITPKWSKRDYSGIRTVEEAIEVYKLSLYCGQLTEIKNYELGSIAIRIGWLYRLIKNGEEMRFLKVALNLFTESYYKEDISSLSIDELTLGYMIGELNRRTGDINKARIWFSNLLSNRRIKENPRMESLVREQWYLIKEEQKVGD